jgi:hypothetical protein
MNPPASPAGSDKNRDVPFGVNAMRLSASQWISVVVLVLLIILSVPRIWQSLEQFDTPANYRVPYQLSQDYWLYERWLDRTGSKIMVLGDSVVWGEYVLPDGTLSHFLNRDSGKTNAFGNAGMNGLFPLALEGLVRYYGGSLRHKKVLLQCNLLWMSSPKADLQVDKEERFNHSRLVPQFSPIPCYRADANERLAAVVERNLRLAGVVNHIQHAWFGGKSILNWTLQDDGGDPPHYTNSYRNPLSQIGLAVPSAPANDPQRGPASPRHQPWLKNASGPSHFEWVKLDTSLQWQAFQRLVNNLRANGNDLFIILGPFNEHMIAPESLEAYRELHKGAAAWFAGQQLKFLAPESLPSNLYADASHPLTEGYELLSKRLMQNPSFRAWSETPVARLQASRSRDGLFSPSRN